MAVNIEIVAEKVFNLLAGNGYDISNLNSKGEKVVDPQEATRFVVIDPNILVRLDKATETLSMGVRETFEDDGLRGAFKHLASDYLMNFDYRIFGKTLKPKSETIDIAKKSEKKMGDVLEALNTMRQLAGLEPLEEADVIKEFQDVDRYTKEIAFEFLNHWMKILGYPEENPRYPGGVYALMDIKGRRHLADRLYNSPQYEGIAIPIQNYAMAVQLVDEFFDTNHDLSLGWLMNRDSYSEAITEGEWNWNEYESKDGYDRNYSRWLGAVNDSRHKYRINVQGGHQNPDFQTLSDSPKAHEDFQTSLQSRGIDINDQKKISLRLEKEAEEEKQRKQDEREKSDAEREKQLRAQRLGTSYSTEKGWTNVETESIGEGFSAMSGSSKTSYQGLGSVKLLVRHKKEVNEETRGARSRNIHSIFIQRGDERFKMAENNLKAARAMARHIKNGGEPYDNIGHAINEMATEQRKLREFVRYVKRAKLVNEENESYVNIAVENINYITTAFTKLAGVRSYATAVEDVSDRRNTEVLEDDIDLESKFTETHFDEKVASVTHAIKSAMSRKSSFENHIDKAVSMESFATLKNVLSENDGIEFATPYAKLGYQVSQMSNSVSDSHLGNYLSGISKKLYSGDRMSQHEYTTIKSCLLGAHKRHEVPTSVVESVEDQYEKFIEQFDIL